MIETERCRALPVSENDREDIARLYASPAVRAHLGGPVDSKTFASRFDDMLTQSDGYAWAVSLKDPGSFIGLVSLDRHHGGEDMEVSYQFMPDSWGKGFAAEVVGAVVNHALKDIGLPHVVAETQLANEHSKRLLEKIGMTQLRRLTRYNEPQVIYEARL